MREPAGAANRSASAQAAGDILIARDLRKTYTIGQTRLEVVKGIHLSVPRGSVMAIVGASGEPLNWIGNKDDLKELMTFLPAQYHDACRRTVKSFAATEKDISAFSQSYQQPRSSATDQVAEE